MTASLLIFAVGNESRGDDALAPLLVRGLEDWVEATGLGGRIDLIEDYQLQVEHVIDLAGRRAVLFADADASCDGPFHLSGITGTRDNSYTSHAMTPAALLHAYRQVYGEDSPPAFLLRVRGYDFGLGNPLSTRATANLEAAAKRLREWCCDASPRFL